MKLFISKNIKNTSIFNNYIGFLGTSSKLPSCKIYAYKTDIDQDLYEDIDISNKIREVPDTKIVLHEGIRCMSHADGIIFQSNDYRDHMCFVDNNYEQIDMMIQDEHTMPRSVYNLLLKSFQMIAVHANALMLHASAVIYRGEAIVFCGASGDGKSTQAYLWRDYYDAEPINYDHPCVVLENEIPYVCGTPWGGKESVCKNISAPIKAIVFLHKNEHSSVRKLSIGEAFARLMMINAIPSIRPELSRQLMDTVELLAKSVPVYQQEGCITREAPDTLYGELYGTHQE